MGIILIGKANIEEKGLKMFPKSFLKVSLKLSSNGLY